MNKRKFSEPPDDERLRNPFVRKIKEFPGRILLFRDFDADLAKLHEIVNEREVVVEIGSGSGGHLIELARRNPETLYVGLELRYKRAVRTIEKSLNLTNTFVLHLDGRTLPQVFKAGTVSGVYLNFPEPWERHRHIKHRVVSPDFLLGCYTVLKPGGFFSFKSDHNDYFKRTNNLFTNSELFEVQAATDNLYSSELLADNVQSEFERLFVYQGKKIGYLLAVRR